MIFGRPCWILWVLFYFFPNFSLGCFGFRVSFFFFLLSYYTGSNFWLGFCGFSPGFSIVFLVPVVFTFWSFWYRRVPSVDSVIFSSDFLYLKFLLSFSRSLLLALYFRLNDSHIDSSYFLGGEDCVNGYTYIIICIDCKWFRIWVDPPFIAEWQSVKKEKKWRYHLINQLHVVKCIEGKENKQWLKTKNNILLFQRNCWFCLHVNNVKKTADIRK